MMGHLDAVVRFVITTLFAGLWQAPLFALTAWLVLRIRPNANATTRHSVLAAALFASLLLPPLTSALTLRHVPDGSASTSGDVVPPRGAVPFRPVRPEAGAAGQRPSDEGWNAPANAFSVPAISRVGVTIPRTIAFVLAGLWLAGASFVLLRLIVSLLHLERLKRDALPLAIDYREQLTRWNSATAGRHNVRLCTSPEIEIPIAVGLFDAMILVPDRLIADLQPHDIDSIVLHELAHLRRSDDWLNAIERFAQAFLFFNPGILWLVAQLDLEREVACDDWVLQRNDALPYATCLARVAETTAWPHRAMSAPGAFVTRRGMSIRIERLLSKQRDVRVRTSLGPAGAAVAVLGVLGALAALVSPSIAYDVAQTPQTTAQVIVVPHALPSPVPVPKRTVVSNAKPAPPAAPAARASVAPVASVASVAPAAVSNPYPHPYVKPDPHPDVVVSVRIARRAEREAKRQQGATGAKLVAASAQDEEAEAKASAAEAKADAAGAKTEVVADATDPDYIDELANEGYSHLSVDQLVALKSVGVTAEFIRSLRREGFSHLGVDDLVKFRALGIDPAYASAMRKRFSKPLDVGDIAGLRALGVSAEYLDGLSAAGLKNLRPSQVQSLRALDVTPDYVRGLARAGYPSLSPDQLQSLRALGIDADVIARATAQGLRNLSVDQLLKLRASGVL